MNYVQSALGWSVPRAGAVLSLTGIGLAVFPPLLLRALPPRAAVALRGRLYHHGPTRIGDSEVPGGPAELPRLGPGPGPARRLRDPPPRRRDVHL